MTNPTSDSGSGQNRNGTRRAAGWLKLAAVAAASALAGGLAAAWWHRKTLDKLQQGGEQNGDRARNPEFGISEPETHDDL